MANKKAVVNVRCLRSSACPGRNLTLGQVVEGKLLEDLLAKKVTISDDPRAKTILVWASEAAPKPEGLPLSTLKNVPVNVPVKENRPELKEEPPEADPEGDPTKDEDPVEPEVTPEADPEPEDTKQKNRKGK